MVSVVEICHVHAVIQANKMADRWVVTAGFREQGPESYERSDGGPEHLQVAEVDRGIRLEGPAMNGPLEGISGLAQTTKSAMHHMTTYFAHEGEMLLFQLYVCTR